MTTGSDEGTITVDVEDAQGNLETSDDSTLVSLSLETSPKGATLEVTPVDDNDGVATFSNVLLTDVGSYILKATGSGLASGLSSSFSVKK